MLKLLLYIIIVIILILIIVIIVAKNNADKNNDSIDGNNILILIAHPDDEAMFFTPTVSKLYELEKNLHVICLSNGNHEGIGNKREKELYQSLYQFDIIDDRIYIGSFDDGPNNDWNIQDISKILDEHVKKWNIDTIITFDKEGVSGHPNHIACYNALVYYFEDNIINGLTLQSVMAKEKFLGPLPMLYSSKIDITTLSSYNFRLKSYKKAWRQMSKHPSQFTWYRKLFIIFSQYSYVNKLNNVRKK